MASPAAAVWSGGNESSGTPLDSPHSPNGICLAESAIGQTTAQTAGYPNAATDLAAIGDNSRTAGNAYQYTNYGAGPVTIPAVAWSVVFPGGFNPANGSNYVSDVSSTYIAGDIEQAESAIRARLEVTLGDTNAAQELVMLVEDRMLPLEWSGTMAMAYSAYARMNGFTQNGTNVETLVVDEARGYFRSACDAFSQFLGNPPDALLVEGQNTLLSSSVTNQVERILDDYLRDLAEYAEASLTDFQLRNLANFYDPTVPGSQPSQALLSDIDNTVSEIQMRLLLASPFQNLPLYSTSAAGQVKGLLHDLGRLHQSIVLGRVTFNAGASDNPNGDPSLNYGEFTTAFVPFFTGLANPGNSSFDIALSLAQNFAGYAASQEDGASNAIVAVLQRQYDWTSEQQNLQNQYLSQLQNLCGYMLDTNGNPAPDIFFAALPPGIRESVAAQYLPPGFYQLNETGTIYQQWQAVEIAETNLLLATIQLTNTFATMTEKVQIAEAIYNGQAQLAELILTNGQQISAIDQQQGQIQAQADQAIAQIQATTAQQEANSGFWGDLAKVGEVIGAAVATYFTAGASSPLLAAAVSGAVGGATQIQASLTASANANDQASADLKIGSVQANEATQIAALNAQIEQINANEQAQAEYLQANTTMLDLSADLLSLQQQAQSQEIQIQLASQQVDQEKSKLANMISQVSSLMNQWMRSGALIAQDPEFNSNLLLIRSDKIQQANDAFTLAQEWAFLTALTLTYKDNCPSLGSSNFVQRVLAARNSSALTPILNDMSSVDTLISAGCQSSPIYSEVQFSVRNNFFQANQTQGSGSNTVVTSYEPVLQGGTVLTNATGSDAAWTSFLASNILTNQFGERVLTIDFSTSLDQQIAGGLQRNPLFSCDTFGTTLYSGSDGNGNELHGVQVSLVTQGFTFPLGPGAGFEVEIAQVGTSVIRNRGFGNQTSSSPGFRYFNFGAFTVGMTASANDLLGNGGTAVFQDRSPANSQWKLSLNESDSANNAALLANLNQFTDIQLQFNLRGYIDQIAAQLCNQ